MAQTILWKETRKGENENSGAVVTGDFATAAAAESVALDVLEVALLRSWSK